MFGANAVPGLHAIQVPFGIQILQASCVIIPLSSLEEKLEDLLFIWA